MARDPRYPDPADEAAAERELMTALGEFLSVFTIYEAHYVSNALTILSDDAALVSHLGELLTLEHKLVLLKRMAAERGIKGALLADLDTARRRAKKLLEHRNEIVHNAPLMILLERGPNVPAGIAVGIKRPKSKRREPTENMSAEQYVQGRLHDLGLLRDYTRQLEQLHLMMKGINERLFKHRRGVTGANI